MINREDGVVEVVPASPPPSVSERLSESPEIRVTDSPKSSVSSPRGSPASSPSIPNFNPLLFQPFLSLPQFNQPLQRVLPFSIDNILKPTFGPSSSSPPKEDGSHKPVDLTKQEEVRKDSEGSKEGKKDDDVPPGMVRGPNGQLWPAWVFCTRYSDRPSSGPRARKMKKAKEPSSGNQSSSSGEEKRPRTAFSSDQLARLKKEFDENRYLNEDRRRSLAKELGLNETQIKIWFQNKRAKLKKTTGGKGDLAKMLAAQGLYNHATMAEDEDDFPGM